MKKDLTNRNQKVQSNQFFWNLKRKFKGNFAFPSTAFRSFRVENYQKKTLERGMSRAWGISLFIVSEKLFLNQAQG